MWELDLNDILVLNEYLHKILHDLFQTELNQIFS